MSNAYISTIAVPNAHNLSIYAVVATENYTITGAGDGDIIVWDNNEEDPKPIKLKQGGIGIHHLATTSDGSLLVAVGFNGRPVVYDLKSLEEKKEVGELANVENAWAVAIAADNPVLAISTVSGAVQLWNLESFELINTLSTKQQNFGVSVDISPGGSYVACGHENGNLYVYNVKKARLEYSFSGHKSCIRSVKFSPDGSFLAAGGDAKVIFIYQVASGEHIMNLSGHEGWIFSLGWDIESTKEDGLFLLSAAHDGKIKLWSLEARSSVYAQGDSDQPLFSVAWLKKGWGNGVIGGFSRGFVTVGVDKTIRWYRSASAGK